MPVGENAQVTAVVGTDQFESYKGGLRGGLYHGTTDFAAVAYTDGQEHFGGVDIRGDNVVGWWLEGGGVFTAEDDPAMKFSLGADYSFFVLERLYIAAQVSHDGTGEVPALYDWNSRQPDNLRLTPCENYDSLPIPEPSDDHRQTLGRWYGLNYIIWDLTEDWSLTNITIVNIADGTGMLFPTTTLLIGDRISANAGAQMLFGSEGEFRPPSYQTQVADTDISGLTATLTGLAWIRYAL